MALLVQKYGGSSVGTLDRIHHVAAKVMQAKQQGHDVVVVVSAMQGETDRLIQLAHTLTPTPNAREYDALIATGEQVSIALLSMALNAKNCSARSYSSLQVGIMTDDTHSNARILEVKTDVIRKDLATGHVVIVAGFQGVNTRGDVTTLGRGGSDTTAVALAAALKADECQIYTDVDGVYTTDPRILPEASLLSQISFEEMLAMASVGAKVLQMRSVELASKHNMPVRVLSTFTDGPGTLVTTEDKVLQKRLVSGIAFNRETALVSLTGMTKTGMEKQILAAANEASIEIDMMAQNTSGKATDVTFTVQRQDHAKALDVMTELAKGLSAAVRSQADVAKLSLVGSGVRSQADVANTMSNALDQKGINIQMITTSEIKISVVIAEKMLENGVRAVHEAFELEKLSTTKQQAPMEI